MKHFQPDLSILPPAQRELWAQLAPLPALGFVLYGGTAIALRMAHRQSIDFDFFTATTLNAEELRRQLPFLHESELVQEHRNTLEVRTSSGVKVSFFGGLDFGRVGEPEMTADGILAVASLDDLMATKLKTILQRSELKDYQDIAAMLRTGVQIEIGLAAAEQMFRPHFSPVHTLKALVYFEDGDLPKLAWADRETLMVAVRRVKALPTITLAPGLSA